MRAFALTLAIATSAGGALAAPAIAEHHDHCPPGSEDSNYCEHEPGDHGGGDHHNGNHHDGDHHRGDSGTSLKHAGRSYKVARR